MKIAVQPYNVRGSLAKDRIDDTLGQLAEMGCDGAEWFGLAGYEPDEIKSHMDKARLKLFSMHIDQSELDSPNVPLLDQLARIGIKYIPIGWLPLERLAGGARFDETCAKLIEYSRLTNERGMYLMYHNHDFDLAPFRGATLLDALYSALPPERLGAELDTCWLYTGGVDPTEYIQKYGERAPVIHVKDCVREGGRAGFKPVGSGALDWQSILSVCGSAEWLCIEQDEPSDGLTPFECAKASIDFLRANRKI